MGPPIVTKLTNDFVWQRFEIKKNEKDPNDLSKVICTICKTVLSRGPDPSKWGVYTLKRHYEKQHPIEFSELAKYLENRMPELTNTPSSKRPAENQIGAIRNKAARTKLFQESISNF